MTWLDMQKDSRASSTGKPQEQEWTPALQSEGPQIVWKPHLKCTPIPICWNVLKASIKSPFQGQHLEYVTQRGSTSSSPPWEGQAHLLNTNLKYFTFPVSFFGIFWQMDLKVNFKVWFDYRCFLGFLHWFPDTALLCRPVSSESVEWWFGPDSLAV